MKTRTESWSVVLFCLLSRQNVLETQLKIAERKHCQKSIVYYSLKGLKSSCEVAFLFRWILQLKRRVWIFSLWLTTSHRMCQDIKWCCVRCALRTLGTYTPYYCTKYSAMQITSHLFLFGLHSLFSRKNPDNYNAHVRVGLIWFSNEKFHQNASSLVQIFGVCISWRFCVGKA